MRHAPAWFRRVLVRRYKRRAEMELRRDGEITTRLKRDADWRWW